MKKEFKRPSQNMMEATEGVAVVTDIPSTDEPTKELGGVASKYIKYSEVQDATKVNCFKATISPRIGSNFLNVNGVETAENYEFSLPITKMLSMRFKMGDVRKYLEEAISKYVLEESNQAREKKGEPRLSYDDRIYDVDWNIKAKVVKEIKFANSKDKEFLAILDKNLVIKTDAKQDMISQLEQDPEFSINYDVIPQFIKHVSLGEFKIKSYGEELVVVLDIDKVIANVVIPYIMTYSDSELDISKVVSLGNSVYANGYINTIISIDNVDDTSDAKILLDPSQFVCGRFQMSHEVFRNKLVGYWTSEVQYEHEVNGKMVKDVKVVKHSKPLTSLSEDADIIFVRTADIAAQSAGADALKNQMLGAPNGINYVTVPLIKVSKAKYCKSFRKTGNPMLDSLLDASSKVDVIDDKAILGTFSFLLDGTVSSFNVGRNAGQDLAVLPNFRNLTAFSIFGNLSGVRNLPRIDVADNGHDIAIVVSI